MGLDSVLVELADRSTFGTTLVLNDGRLKISEGLTPDRVTIMGACSNQSANAQRTEYLIPTGDPFKLVQFSDLRYFRNDDPDAMPSEILEQFEDAFEAGAKSFEFVIVTRTVGQLGGDVTDSGNILPVSTVFTNKVSAVSLSGAHPTGNIGAAAFTHNGMAFFIGGERPDTPATGSIDVGAEAAFATDDYIRFNHTNGTVYAFWFDKTGAATVPAAVQTLVDAGAFASKVTITGLTDEQTADALCAAIETSNLPISAYDGGAAGVIALESDEPGTDGNLWTLVDVATGVASVAGMTGGAATNTISRKMVKWNPTTELWSNVTNVSGVPIRMVVARRDSGAARFNGTVVHVAGGMTTLRGAATDTAVTAIDTLTFTSASTSTATVATGTVLGAAHGEGTWVQIASATYLVFGGNVAVGAATTRTDAVFEVGVLVGETPMVDSTINMTAATRWAGAYYDSINDLVYVAGGDTVGGAISETEVWDVGAVDFSTTVEAGNMLEARYDFAFVAVNNNGWAIGGTNGTDDLDSIDRFDSASLTWQQRSSLDAAASGGRATVVGYDIVYADASQGAQYDIGLGDLADSSVGFPSTYPFYVRVDNEVMQVTGVTTTVARGRDCDAFVVTRGQKGSTAIGHADWSDVVEDDEVLYDDLDEALAMMMNTSVGDYVMFPQRAAADSPFLPVGTNFAYLLAKYCYNKGRFDRSCMGVIGVHPSHEDPSALPTLTEISTWVTTMKDFSRTNFNSDPIWTIADGVTDANGDKKPDTYAFWATDDGAIPAGSPPMDAGKVTLDEDDHAIDLGKYLFLVYPWGFSSGDNYTKKHPNADFGWYRSSAASYAGGLCTLEPDVGSTNMAVRGFSPYRMLSLVQENQLNRRRYVGIVNMGSLGFRWNTGYTFAWNVSQFSRSDYVLGSTFRKMVQVDRVIRDIAGRYFGKAVLGPHINAFQTDISHAIAQLVDNGIIGPGTDYEFIVSRADKVIGHGKLVVNAEYEGEMVQLKHVFSNKLTG